MDIKGNLYFEYHIYLILVYLLKKKKKKWEKKYI